MQRQVAKTLTMINLCMDANNFDNWLFNIINDAVERFKKHDKLWLNEFTKYFEELHGCNT
jgi:hypothetical protein